MGQKESKPILVVVCNQHFKERDRIPAVVANIRIIVSYEDEIKKEEMDAMKDDTNSEEEDDDEEDSEDENNNEMHHEEDTKEEQ